MNEESKQYRKRIYDEIKVLGSPLVQMMYEDKVPIADVPAELICGFIDDLYCPKSEQFLNAFTEQELKALAELYGRLCIASDAIAKHNCHSVRNLQKLPEWRSMMAYAKTLLTELKINDNTRQNRCHETPGD